MEPEGLWPGYQLLALKVFPQLNGLLWAARTPTSCAEAAWGSSAAARATTRARVADLRLIGRTGLLVVGMLTSLNGGCMRDTAGCPVPSMSRSPWRQRTSTAW